MKSRRIIVMGYMGGCPIAGVMWQYLHYLVGLQRLGHDVYYIEDSARYPYDPVRQTIDADYGQAARTLSGLGERFGFAGKWAYCPRYLPERVSAGMSMEKVRELYRTADAILNVCGAQELNDDLLASSRILMVESDPAFLQVKVDKGDQDTIDYLNRHHALFTFGENVGAPSFSIPSHGFEWLPSRQPVVTDLWATNRAPAANASFTTVMNWSAMASIEWRGKTYFWNKPLEFMKFVDAPVRVGERMEITTDIPDVATRELFVRNNWQLRSPEAMNLDPDEYRAYIQ